MTPMGNLVVLWGGALLLANVLFDPIFATLRANVTSGQAGASDLNTSPVHMVLVGLLSLLVLGFLSNNNPKLAKAFLAALAGLTILWLISYNKDKGTSTEVGGGVINTQAPTSANAATANAGAGGNATTGQVSGASLGTGNGPGGKGSGYNPSPSGNAYTLPPKLNPRGFTLSPSAQRLINQGG